MTSILDLRAFEQILRQLNPKERTICKWQCFNGRTVELLQGEIGGVCTYCQVVFDKHGDLINGEDFKPTEMLSVQDYMQNKGIDSLEDGKRSYLQWLAFSMQSVFFNKIPLLDRKAPHIVGDYLNLTLIKEWEVPEDLQGPERIAILKKELLRVVDKSSYVWRFTLGKVHTFVEEHFKVLCCFPSANRVYPVNSLWIEENGYPKSGFMMIEQTCKEFVKDHSLEKIKDIQINGTKATQLSFTPNYHTERSKFNRMVVITPYEWAVTLISYSRSIDCIPDALQTGHAAIIIESVKDGKYYAEQAHACFWAKHLGKDIPNALRIVLTEAGANIPFIGPDGEVEKIRIEKEGEVHWITKKKRASLS
jgi:hypothetical protein